MTGRNTTDKAICAFSYSFNIGCDANAQAHRDPMFMGTNRV